MSETKAGEIMKMRHSARSIPQTFGLLSGGPRLNLR